MERGSTHAEKFDITPRTERERTLITALKVFYSDMWTWRWVCLVSVGLNVWLTHLTKVV